MSVPYLLYLFYLFYLFHLFQEPRNAGQPGSDALANRRRAAAAVAFANGQGQAVVQRLTPFCRLGV
jgi:hypothetical protein